jgi:hypothetical protein
MLSQQVRTAVRPDLGAHKTGGCRRGCRRPPRGPLPSTTSRGRWSIRRVAVATLDDTREGLPPPPPHSFQYPRRRHHHHSRPSTLAATTTTAATPAALKRADSKAMFELKRQWDVRGGSSLSQSLSLSSAV